MIDSNWGSWFVRNDIERSNIDGVLVWYLGGNGVVVRSSETTIYIDPYFGNGDPPWLFRMVPVPMDPTDATQCDAVLVTHEHVDHMHPPSFMPLVNDLGADLHAPATSFTDQRGYDGEVGISEERRHVVATKDTVDIGDFTVHVRGSNDPDAIEPVSYVLEHEEGTFFHAGDSRPSEAFYDIGDEFDIDIGVLAFGTAGNVFDPAANEVGREQFYMDENEVIEAANALQMDRLVPTHYDLWRGVGADPKSLHEHATAHEFPKVLEVAKVGDCLNLSTPGVGHRPELA